MYGTVGRIRIKKEHQDTFLETLKGQGNVDIPGFKNGFVMFPENREGEAIMVAIFEDRDSYWKNANDPEQDKRYQEFSKYFEGEPEWSDGEWLEA
jgi:hypothetical protein